MQWRKRYEAYIASPKWRGTRLNIIRMRGYQCERCGCTDGIIQLHHKTYIRLGNELPCDLELLCIDCHEIADWERTEESSRMRTIKRYNAAMNTYCRKKYGDDWHDLEFADRIIEEFDEWLERQE